MAQGLLAQSKRKTLIFIKRVRQKVLDLMQDCITETDPMGEDRMSSYYLWLYCVDFCPDVQSIWKSRLSFKLGRGGGGDGGFWGG